MMTPPAPVRAASPLVRASAPCLSGRTAPPVLVAGDPPRARVVRPLFTEADPARGMGRPLFGSPIAPASPRTRRVFHWSEPAYDSDSDPEPDPDLGSYCGDPDSPRFFDSPIHVSSSRLISDFVFLPPTVRARYQPPQQETSRGGAIRSKSSSAPTGARGASKFSLNRLEDAVARAWHERGHPAAPSARQHSSGPAHGQGAEGVHEVAVPGDDLPDAPFILTTSSGPAVGESTQHFILFRLLDLYEEYENLSVKCFNIKKMVKKNTPQSQVEVVWKRILDRLIICQEVRMEIKAAGGTVDRIPFDLICVKSRDAPGELWGTFWELTCAQTVLYGRLGHGIPKDQGKEMFQFGAAKMTSAAVLMCKQWPRNGAMAIFTEAVSSEA